MLTLSVAAMSLVGAGWVSAWLVPSLLAVLVIAASWAGIRVISAEHLASLAGVPLFSALSRAQLRSVARSARRVEYSPGDAVTKEGEAGNSLYVIERGTARVTVKGEPKATLGPAGHFGEVALIDSGPRTATITAETLMSTLELPSGALNRLLDRDPAFARAIHVGLEGILRRAGASVPEDDRPSTDRATLTDLCRRVRQIQPTDWAQPPPSGRRWLAALGSRRR